MNDANLLRTPLYACHQKAGARLVDFAGWEMPVQYSGVIDEHRAVRTAAGLFDVSHMGQIHVRGPQAEAYLQWLTPNDLGKLAAGRAHYSAFLTERGTYVDDLLVYRLGPAEFLIVVNASNADKDFAWAEARTAGFDVEIDNVSHRYALLALQGPRAIEILAPLTTTDLSAIKYYGFAHGQVDGARAILSRTGYTGEDGFELYVDPEEAPRLWDRLLVAGAAHGLIPAGLGARDTLRLEAAMALYGHEIDDQTTPLEANLMWAVKLDKGDFVGRDALVSARETGIARRLVGFEVVGKGIARQGHAIVSGDDTVGVVTSGTYSPTFEKALGMAYVPLGSVEPGSPLELDIRGKRVAAVVVPLPFYRRPR
jgi:aminomethyltransferase